MVKNRQIHWINANVMEREKQRRRREVMEALWNKNTNSRKRKGHKPFELSLVVGQADFIFFILTLRRPGRSWSKRHLKNENCVDEEGEEIVI